MSELRTKLIRLAYQKPELRADLLPLITRQAAEGGSEKHVSGWTKFDYEVTDDKGKKQTIQRFAPTPEAAKEDAKKLVNTAEYKAVKVVGPSKK